MITSASNPRVKELALLGKKSKERKERGVFLAEGIKMFSEAPREWIQKVYVSESFMYGEENCRMVADVNYDILSDSAFKAACDTKTPQGILAVVKMPKWDFTEILADPDGCYLFLENIQDPGNLGTMIRTAEAAGITAVIASDTAADVYNPKTVRATMGSIFRMPYLETGDFKGVIRQVKENGAAIYAAHLQGGKLYDEPDYRGACGFLIGNESGGLTGETAALADETVQIPIAGKAESLNAAIAAAVFMYEANRQRRR